MVLSDFIFLGSKITADGDCSHEIKRRLILGRKAMTNLDSISKNRHYFANKGPSSLSYSFSSSHVWMWELDYKESWVQKNWCFWTMVLEKTLESPLDRKEIQPVHPKGDWSVLGVHWKDWCWNSNTLATSCKELSHWKRPWCWERLKAGREGDDEDEMVGWHHQLNECEFEQALGVGDGQEGLACCDSWGHKELDTTGRLNWTELTSMDGLIWLPVNE